MTADSRKTRIHGEGNSQRIRVLSPRGLRWVLSMAWRDSRGQRRKLFLFTLCVVFGVGALVAIESFRHNLERTIDDQAQLLLGADLALRSRRPFSASMERFITSMGGEQAREVRFRSMAYFVDRSRTRLVQVRALDGNYPFYGEIETAPQKAVFRDEGKARALVEESLLIQFGARIGDAVRLGRVDFEIAGSLLRVPGENEVRGLFSPRIYIDQRFLLETGLVQRGSLTSYRVFFKLAGGIDRAVEANLRSARDGLLAEERVRLDTVESRKRRLGRAMDNFYEFLNLIGFVALLLGGIGVAGAVQVYLKEKLNTVAVLRCLGAGAFAAFSVSLVQVIVVAFLGVLMGSMLGVSVQYFLPAVLASFLPFEVPVFVSWPSLMKSASFGWIVILLFSFIPLLSVRSVAPLRALRASVEEEGSLRKDPFFWVVVFLIVIVVLGFSVLQTSRLSRGLVFAGVLAGSLLLLGGLSSALRWILRRFFPRSWPFAWRQGLMNLYRPNNRTLFLVVTLGMGTFLISTIHHAQSMLLQQAEFDREGERPNLVLFDIQNDQVAGVTEQVRSAGYSVIETVPIVTMRLAKVDGQTISAIKRDPRSQVERWAMNWEYRSTFRGELIDTEEIREGEFVGAVSGLETVPISLEGSIAEELKVGIGDTLTFDVQGIPVLTVISSIRKVDWATLRPNFYVVFPNGVLEEAPAFHALVTRVPDRLAVARLQESLVEAYPNVSAIDLSLVLETMTSILDRVSFVIRFIAFFTVATGVVVLAGAVVTSRYQRIRESVLLATLGASSRVIRQIMTVEYLFLGLLAGSAGSLLSLISAWGLSRFVFKIPYHVSLLAIPLAILLAAALTLFTGLLNSRGIARYPPLAILREEG